MGKFFSRVNAPTLVAALVAVAIDKKLGITDAILARIG
jgi:hypothetical protein